MSCVSSHRVAVHAAAAGHGGASVWRPCIHQKDRNITTVEAAVAVAVDVCPFLSAIINHLRLANFSRGLTHLRRQQKRLVCNL